MKSHSPQGECGLKSRRCVFLAFRSKSHSPQGECGLKFGKLGIDKMGKHVTPRKGSVD